MKVALLPVLIIMLLLSVGGGYLVGTNSNEADTEIAKTPDDSLEVQVVVLREYKPEYTIELSYPQFDPAVDPKVRAIVDKSAHGIRAYAREHPPGSLGASGIYSLRGNFSSLYLGPEIISLQLVTYSYLGGAHGSSTTYGINVDRVSGRELTLDDALNLIGLPLSEVSTQAATKLVAKLGQTTFSKGALPLPENYATFVITADQVTFIFQEYQVASYADGVQAVSFPRELR